jgi:hypothetical protein
MMVGCVRFPFREQVSNHGLKASSVEKKLVDQNKRCSSSSVYDGANCSPEVQRTLSIILLKCMSKVRHGSSTLI